MKILFVITGADIGGAQKHVLHLSQWFKEAGHQVHVVTGEEGPLKEELTYSGIDVTVISIPRKIELLKDIMALFKLNSFIKKGKYDIVHSHSSKAGILARISSFIQRTPKNIFTAHGFVFTDPTLSHKKKIFYIWLERTCGWLSTDIITVSQYDYDFGTTNGINKMKMHVVHNGVPANHIISKQNWKAKQDLLRKAEKRIIGFVARFSPEKNIDMLLRVAELFKKQNILDVEIWMLGDGPLFDHYKGLIYQKDLEKIIKLKGNQENILQWMDQMHSLMVTSHKEGLPYVLLEAISRGLPVISTDVGGIKEVLQLVKAHNELMVPIDDDEMMFDKLTNVLYNDDHREEIGEQLWNIAEQFSVETMCLKINEIYHKQAESKHNKVFLLRTTGDLTRKRHDERV